MEKGTWGYMDSMKKAKARSTMILAVIVVVLILVVFFISGTVRNLAIAIPLLMMIPTANIMVQWIVIVRFQSLKEEEQETIEKHLAGRANCVILYDMALSSTESVSFAPCLVIDQGNIYLLWGGSNDKKYDERKQQEYVQGLIIKTAYNYQAYTAHSVEELIEAVEAAPVAAEDRMQQCEHLKKRLMDISF